VHGFRSTASTLLNELGWDSALIELQLAHVKRDAVTGVYDRSQQVTARRKMMQEWADYIDGLRAEARKPA
jgi:integrase